MIQSTICILLLLCSTTSINAQPCPDNCLCKHTSKLKSDFKCSNKMSDYVWIRLTKKNHLMVNYKTCTACDDANLLPDIDMSSATAVTIEHACHKCDVTGILKKLNVIGLKSLRLLQTFNLRLQLGFRLDLEEFTLSYALGCQIDGGFLKNLPKLTRLTLQQVATKEVLKIDFAHASSLKFLSLSNNKLKELPGFSNLAQLKTLDLSRNYLEDVHLQGLTSLETLDLSYNRIKILREDTFSRLPSLRQLFLDQNFITKIHGGVFKNLELLSLKKNVLLQELPEDTFRSTSNLKELRLSNLANLTELPEKIFDNLTKLESLDLSSGNLNSLPQDLFRNQRHLKVLNVSDNKFTSISNRTFLHLENLTSLKLTHTPTLSCVDDNTFLPLKGMRYLDLAYNNLSKWNLDWFCNEECRIMGKADFHLEILNLKGNWIQGVPKGVLHVDYLDLDANRIEDVKLEDFLKFNPTAVNLANNHLKTIDLTVNPNILRNLSTKILININHNNLLQCGCANLMLHRYNHGELAQIKSIFDIRQEDVYCATTGAPVKEVRPCDARCPLIVHPCTWVRECDDGLTVNCSGRNLSELSGEGFLRGGVNITKLDFSWNAVQEVRWLPKDLRMLNLSHNNLKTLSSSMLNLLNASKSLKTINLDHNPWECDCPLVESKNLLLNHFKMINISHIPCLTEQAICAPTYEFYVILIPASLLLLSVVLLLYCKYRIKLKMLILPLWPRIPGQYAYNVFLLYSEGSLAVAEELLLNLQGMHLRVLHPGNWLLGATQVENIIEGIENSGKILLVFSMDALDDPYLKLAFQKAYSICLQKFRRDLILVIEGELCRSRIRRECPHLARYLDVWTGIKWDDNEHFWYNLKESLVAK